MLYIRDIPEDQIVIYDTETDSVYAPYCSLKMISYQMGLSGEPKLLGQADLKSESKCEEFRNLLLDPHVIKVSYNGVNFDDIVLMRHGFYVEPKRRHDMFLALKTIAPSLPSYSLKFVSWYYFGDWHEPQRRMNAWLARNGYKRKQMWNAPEEILGVYCQHDVRQTAKVFRMVWEVVQRKQHWRVYNDIELAMAEPLHEMVLLAGEWLDIPAIEKRISELHVERNQLCKEVTDLSKGKIVNPGSSLQVSKYLHDEDKIELELSKAGNYSLRKDDLVDLRSSNPIAARVLSIRDIGKVIQHLESHLDAAIFEQLKRGPRKELLEWLSVKGLDISISSESLDRRESISRIVHGENGIEAVPKGYTLSGARTRRFQSSSQFGINFQNQNKRTKVVEQVPAGWLGCWIDSRQIENIVHIWASKDVVRRAAYEADPDWNEYVWLTNQVLQGSYTRKELEEMTSPTNPSWSMYKTYKSTKLALNFFMGPYKFSKLTGLGESEAADLFEQVHQACPAIRKIQNILGKEYKAKGFVTDPFGHIYQSSDLHKLVIYLVQGCGTGSTPKAMTAANYRTLHSIDSKEIRCRPYILNPFRSCYSYAVICGTTHDECAFRISLGLPGPEIVRLIRECLYNMEGRFSPLFDWIPLRAQLSISTTNAGDTVELNHNEPDFEKKLLNDYIYPAQRRYHSRHRS